MSEDVNITTSEPEQAAGSALPAPYAATQNLPGNTFVGPKNGMRGTPAPCSHSRAANNEETATRLWHLSETLTGASFPRLHSS